MTSGSLFRLVGLLLCLVVCFPASSLCYPYVPTGFPPSTKDVSYFDNQALDRAAVRFYHNATNLAKILKVPSVNISVYYNSFICYHCVPQYVTTLPLQQLSEFSSFPCAWGTTWYFYIASDTNSTQYGTLLTTLDDNDLIDKGGYTYLILPNDDIDDGDDPLILLIRFVDHSPYDPNTAMYVVFSLAVFGLVLWNAGKKWYARRLAQKRSEQDEQRRGLLSADFSAPANSLAAYDPSLNALSIASSSSSSASAAAAASALPVEKKARLQSLDSFRGLSLTIMIAVNYGGGGYWYMNHSIWNGLTVADLVFPWFIWMMGVSMAMTFDSLLRKEPTTAEILAKVIRRSCILFALGLFVSNNDVLDTYRVFGVLQRFGVSYFFVSLIICFIPRFQSNSQWVNSPYRDFLPYLYEWAAVIGIVIFHTAITFGLDVPGCGRGYLGAGGLGDNGNFAQCTGGASGYIDKQILGWQHIYHGPTCINYYQCQPYDPEGILGCLTSIVLCYSGVQCGRALLHYKSIHRQILTRWLCWALVFGALALALSNGQANGGTIPLNKNLWSLSFILAMSSTGFLFLSLFYVIIDVLRLWSGAPFLYPGMNSILIYLGSELFSNKFPFNYELSDYDANHHAPLVIRNAIAVSCWLGVAAFCYYKNFFIAI